MKFLLRSPTFKYHGNVICLSEDAPVIAASINSGSNSSSNTSPSSSSSVTDSVAKPNPTSLSTLISEHQVDNLESLKFDEGGMKTSKTYGEELASGVDSPSQSPMNSQTSTLPPDSPQPPKKNQLEKRQYRDPGRKPYKDPDKKPYRDQGKKTYRDQDRSQDRKQDRYLDKKQQDRQVRSSSAKKFSSKRHGSRDLSFSADLLDPHGVNKNSQEQPLQTSTSTDRSSQEGGILGDFFDRIECNGKDSVFSSGSGGSGSEGSQPQATKFLAIL